MVKQLSKEEMIKLFSDVNSILNPEKVEGITTRAATETKNITVSKEEMIKLFNDVNSIFNSILNPEKAEGITTRAATETKNITVRDLLKSYGVDDLELSDEIDEILQPALNTVLSAKPMATRAVGARNACANCSICALCVVCGEINEAAGVGGVTGVAGLGS